MNHAFDLLKRLCDAPGAPGSEHAVRKIFCDELGGDLSCDKTGSVVYEHQGAASTPRIMISGHLDEVAFAVQHVTPEGFIKFTNLGGWWSHTLMSQRVRVMTDAGREILGVISSKPVHFLKGDEWNEVVPLEEMHIDLGATGRDQVLNEFGVALGDPIIPDVQLERMANPDRLLAKAFDNRTGMGLAIQSAQRLRKEGHPNTIFAVGTVQEEVGGQGAMTVTRKVKPDMAIVLEGAPADDTPGVNRDESQGMLGKGAQIRIHDSSTIMNKGLWKLAIKTAEECGIPHQVCIRRNGSTDGKLIHVRGEGVPTIVLSSPCRYIHAHNGIMDMNDYLATIDLIVEMTKRLDRETVAGFTDFLS